MKNTLINVFVFTAGAVVGSLVTWKLVKTKYERIAQEEIESVKETWARLGSDKSDDGAYEHEEEIDDDTDDDSYGPEVMHEYASLARKYAPSSDDNSEEGGGDDEVPYVNGPTIITPEEYGNGNFEHDLYCLTYYSDGVLADDWFVKYDIDETIGDDAVNHFGDDVDDVVYVRNEQKRADYEVVRDYRTYREVVAANPLAHMHGH